MCVTSRNAYLYLGRVYTVNAIRAMAEIAKDEEPPTTKDPTVKSCSNKFNSVGGSVHRDA